MRDGGRRAAHRDSPTGLYTWLSLQLKHGGLLRLWQDYDDSYSIQYAMSHGGCVLTNDRFNDYVEKAVILLPIPPC